MKLKYKVWILLALQTLFLLCLSGFNAYTEKTGETWKIKTVPFDPKDYFYGDYVDLRYEISSIKKDNFVDPINTSRRGTIYVLLKRDDEYSYGKVAKASYDTLKAKGNDEVVLKARILYYDDIAKEAHVTYGFERYYIEENTGNKYPNTGELDAYIKVSPIQQILYSVSK